MTGATSDEIFRIASSVIGVGAIAVGLPGIILYFLNRKGANKKFTLEEEAQDGNTFTRQTQAYQDLLDRANAAVTKLEEGLKQAELATQAALDELATIKRERTLEKDEINDKLNDTNKKLQSLRRLFEQVVSRTNIVLEPEEQDIFDNTVPTWNSNRKPRSA